MDRPHDLVVYGATGFVGELTAAYLAEHAPAGVRIGLAGRSREKLEAVRRRLPAAARDWPLLVADTGDADALRALAEGTRVLATTVGPYARYGLPVVEACARAGTHYADLTGEVLFHRDAIDGFDKVAQDTGAKIVHSCGYDSIPSDLGVFVLHERAAADGAGELVDVDLVATARGGFSGGTIDSMRAQLEAVGADRSRRKIVGDPHSLSPDRAAEPTPRQPSDAPLPGRRGSRGTWTAPFVMASYNTRVVRRSNALLGFAYGRGLRYGETMGFGSSPVGAVAAVGTTVGLAAGLAGMTLPPTRALLDRVLPKPGSGPSAEARAKGWFRMDVEATTTSGRRYHARVSGKGDPGYAATAVMLGESGLCLALDDLPDRAGSLTPATAMGAALVERLVTAGHTYSVTG
ncbi:saccharopine dehydrogenase family protein [Pseudonocardia broussonetiae]|uniref:Enoyl-ACP reductase n=1 Tax=Pseudonocardia broussonetiae TaxID=2736640 RepID=A0A6M6JEK5_9PSEU|nr:saccharopine dehydrogenase NADP-binding domain-containing protein [Pseudonocardia broussonetiae]QJY44829.1 enoyl-ACP reductase [Pseudonocardia broussonetiae]